MVRFVLGDPQPVPYVLPRPPVVGELAVDACAPGIPARVLSNPAPGMLLLDGQDTPVPARQLAAVAPASHPPQVSLVDDGTVPGAPEHLLVEGENAHVADTLLGQGWAGRFDVAYLDPPYDTGTRLSYADARDDWPDFFHARLVRAKELLHPERGVLVVAIDDRRLGWARLICDAVMGQAQFVACVVWDGGVHGQSRLVSVAHDYMLIYLTSAAAAKRDRVTWREPRPGVDAALQQAAKVWAATRDVDAAHKRMLAWYRALGSDHPAKKLAEYSWFEEGTGRLLRPGPVCKPHAKHYDYDVIHPGTGKPVPRPGRGYRYSPQRMQELIAEGRILFRDDPAKGIATKLYLDEMDTRAPHAVFTEARTRAAKRLAAQVGDAAFTYPKDPVVLERWFRLVTQDRPDAWFVDLFAGSGSTGEAVMRMNAADGGTRTAVCVTNNEVSAARQETLTGAGFGPHDPQWRAAGVFETVTAPRLRLVAGETGQGLVVKRLHPSEGAGEAAVAA